MSRRAFVITAAVVAVVVVGVAGWYLFIRDDAPPPVSLDAAVSEATSTTTTSAAVTQADDPQETTTTESPATTSSSTSTAPSSGAGAGADGEWPLTAAESFVGYRIAEELSGIGAATAVGRTSEVVGAMTLEGSLVTAASIEVDMTTLESDSSQRDRQLRDRGLQTNEFPTASFVLTQPMDLGAEPQVGVAVSTVAVGDLTLHGVTREVEIPMEAELVDETTIVAVGSVDVLVEDYDIEKPTGFRVLSIADSGTIEMQLIFAR